VIETLLQYSFDALLGDLGLFFCASTRVNERSEYRRRRCVVMATGLVTFPWLLYIHHGSSGDVTIVGQGQGWLALRLRRLNPIGRNSRLVRLESWFPILVAVAIQAWHSAGLRSTRSHLSPRISLETNILLACPLIAGGTGVERRIGGGVPAQRRKGGEARLPSSKSRVLVR
jgi:hypothetical protein